MHRTKLLAVQAVKLLQFLIGSYVMGTSRVLFRQPALELDHTSKHIDRKDIPGFASADNVPYLKFLVYVSFAISDKVRALLPLPAPSFFLIHSLVTR